MDRKSFDWLATIVYPLAVVLMEAFWVYPWLVWLGSWPMFEESRPVLGQVSVIVVLGTALLATRLLTGRKWSLPLVQFAIIGTGLLVAVLVIAVEYRAGYGFLSGEWFVYIGRSIGRLFEGTLTVVFALPVLVYLWWRGINLSRMTSTFGSIYPSFLLGVVAIIVLIIIWQFNPTDTGFGLNVLAVFFFGLMAIAIAHLYNMRNTMPREEAGLTSAKRWLPIMLGVIGGMVLLVFGLGGIFSRDFYESVGQGMGTVFGALWSAVEVILIPVNYIIEGIYWILRWFFDLIRPAEVEMPTQTPGGEFLPGGETVTPELPGVLLELVKWGVIVIIVALVIYILARAISRFTSGRSGDDIEEIHESLWSWKGLKDDLGLFFGMLGQRFHRRPQPAPSLRIGDDLARLDVREIYRNLQWEGSRSGLARRPHETAREYSRRVSGRIPESDVPLENLTELYGSVRYGEQDPPEKQVDDANVVWRALRGLMRRWRGETESE